MTDPAQADRAAARIEHSLAVQPWEAVLDLFLAGAVDSKATRNAYRREIGGALEALKVARLSDLSASILAAFRGRLLADGRGPGSHRQALAALRSFLGWSRALGAHRLSQEEVAVALRLPRSTVRRPYRAIDQAEIEALLAAAGTARDRALLGVMIGTGLRVAEVSALGVTDLVNDARVGMLLYVRQGKGRKDRVVPVGADVEGLLREYLVESGRTCGSVGPLFLAHDLGATGRANRRLSARSIGIMLAKVAQRAGLDGRRPSPHALRHSFALRALRHGGDVVAVSRLLGHASISTTQRYCDHLGIEELRAIVPLLRAH